LRTAVNVADAAIVRYRVASLDSDTVNVELAESVRYIARRSETVKVADAASDLFIVVMVRDRDAVNVALAEITFWSVFCFTIETVNVKDAANERYVCRIMDTVNVADAESVRYLVVSFAMDTVNVDDALMILFGILESAAVNVADAESVL